MADLKFNSQDIEALARKLATLQPFLTDQEHALLLAIFATAADNTEPSIPAGVVTLPAARVKGQPLAPSQLTVAGLQQQLLSAYVPGNSFDSATGSPDSLPTAKITGDGPPDAAAASTSSAVPADQGVFSDQADQAAQGDQDGPPGEGSGPKPHGGGAGKGTN